MSVDIKNIRIGDKIKLKEGEVYFVGNSVVNFRVGKEPFVANIDCIASHTPTTRPFAVNDLVTRLDVVLDDMLEDRDKLPWCIEAIVLDVAMLRRTSKTTVKGPFFWTTHPVSQLRHA